MDTKSERLEGNLVKLTVTLPPSDVARAIEEAYRDYSGKVRIPGFRKGKIPRPVIDANVGKEAVLADALENLLEETYSEAIDSEGLRPIDRPDMGELDALLEGEAYTYVAEVPVRPEMTLSSLDGLVIHAGPVGVSDADIDLQVEATRERFATLEPVERGVQMGDFALISFVGTVDGEEYEGNAVDKYLYETERGLMPEEFDASLVGAAAGDSVVSSFPIPDTSSNPEFVGKQARFEITVHEVKAKVLPPLDNEFAAKVGGFDTLDDFREDLRTKMESSRAVARTQRIELGARELVASRLEGEIPEAMIESRTNSLTRDFFQSLEERHLTLEGYVNASGVPVDQIQADIAQQAALRVREELALEAVFRAKGLEVTDADVDAALAEIAGPDGDVEKLREDLHRSGATPILMESIQHQKALAWVIENAEVTEEFAAEACDVAQPVKPKRKSAAGAKKKPTKAASAAENVDAAGHVREEA